MKYVSYLNSLLVCIVCMLVWWYGTDGFRAFTSETARRLQVLQEPKVLRQYRFENQYHDTVSFNDFDGKIVLVDFIYTQCPDVCHNLGYAFKSIKEKLEKSGLNENVNIVSISFDLSHDTPDALKAYVMRYSKDMQNWYGLRLNNVAQLTALLNDFGVVVIPDKYGGFQHNAAIHILDQKGRLVGIYDHVDENSILKKIQMLI